MSENAGANGEPKEMVTDDQVATGEEAAKRAAAVERERLPDGVTVPPVISARIIEPLRIFISYRIDPDAPLASALKRLIENAIDPPPEVFVSGDGGLRPSNVGFKRQLQAAAQSAHAFVAIISNASKEREWIFFEAGAAWGRDLIYAPVLVGARPEDLSSTIAEYQALNSGSKEDMNKLMTALAERVGATVKERFGQRYQAFSRTVNQYLTGNPDGENTEKGSGLHTAYRLAGQGEVEQSNEIFDRLEEEAKNTEDRCQLRVYRLQAQKKPQELTRLLSQLDDVLKNTSTFNYHIAMLTDRPQLRDEHLRKAIEIGKGRNAILAILERSRLDFRLGEDERGTQALMTLIKKRSDDYSEKAAKLLVELVLDLSAYEKLLIYLAGLTGARTEGYRDIVELARKSGWNALHLYAAEKLDDLESTGSSANSRGIARAQVELPSLAFESYAEAAKRGVSVARCNMAGMIIGGSSAAAGLAVIDEHKGPFDAADRGYPHALRANLERALDTEREKENGILKKAERQFEALWAFAERILLISDREAFQVSGRFEFGVDTITFDKSGAHATSLLGSGNVQNLRVFGQNAFVFQSEKNVVFLNRMPDRVEALCLEDFCDAGGTRWCQWIGQSENSPA